MYKVSVWHASRSYWKFNVFESLDTRPSGIWRRLDGARAPGRCSAEVDRHLREEGGLGHEEGGGPRRAPISERRTDRSPVSWGMSCVCWSSSHGCLCRGHLHTSGHFLLKLLTHTSSARALSIMKWPILTKYTRQKYIIWNPMEGGFRLRSEIYPESKQPVSYDT